MSRLPTWVDRIRGAMRRDARPLAIAQGIRTAVVTVAPLAVGDLIGHPWIYSWMSLGGFQASSADNGGPYRVRAASMLTVVVGGTFAVFIGSQAGRWPVAAVAVAFAAAFFSGMVRIYGSTGSSVGLLNMAMFLVSLGYPEPHLPFALRRAALFLAGGTVAAVLALFLWPFQPHRMVRRAVGECYRRLAALATLEAEIPPAADARGEAWWTRERAAVAAARVSIEDARAHLTDVRRARDGSMARGEQLLLLLQTAERMLGLLVGLPDLLDAHGGGDLDRARGVLTAVAGVAARIGDVVPIASEPAPIDTRAVDAALRASAGSPGEVPLTVRRLGDEMAIAVDLADAVAQGRHIPVVLPLGSDAGAPAARGGGPSLRDLLVTPLRGTLSWHSLTLRHALRLAVGVSLAQLVVTVVGLPRGYWMTLTAGLILQPYAGATADRAMQRVVGTVIGALIAAALTVGVHGALMVTLVLFPLTVLTMAVRPIGYGYFTLFLTPLFVLIAEGSQSDPKLAIYRVLNTVLGGAFGMLMAATLWPDWEGEELPAVLAAAVEANRRYLATVLSGGAAAHYNAVRRDVGLANANSDAALQRAVSEGRRAAGLIAPGSEVTILMRRMTATVAALAVISEGQGGAPLLAAGSPFPAAADAALGEMAAALRARRMPAVVALPSVDGGGGAGTVGLLLGRVARQIELAVPAVGRVIVARAAVPPVARRTVARGAAA